MDQQIMIGKALGNSVRLQILDELVKGPRTLDALSDSTDLKPESILHHIRILQQVGLLEEFEPIRKGGPGRPYSRYKMTGKNVKIQYPPRNYALLSDILLKHLAKTTATGDLKEQLRKTGVKIGKNLAQTIATKGGADRLDLTVIREKYIEDYLKETGMQPEVIAHNDSTLQYRQYNCPFLELAKKYPGTVCTISEGMMDGFVSKMNEPTKVTRLKSIAADDNCCEYLISTNPTSPHATP
jgi:predicted ArsR family transcriptional regulator